MMSSAPLARPAQSARRCSSSRSGGPRSRAVPETGSSTASMREHQVGERTLAERDLAAALGRRDLSHGVRRSDVVDQRARSGDPGQRQRAVHGLALQLRRPRGRVGPRAGAAGRGVLARQLGDHHVVLGVHDGEAAEPRHLLQRDEEHVVRQLVAVVGHVELEARHAAPGQLLELRDALDVRLAQVHVQPVVHDALARRPRRAAHRRPRGARDPARPAPGRRSS